MTDKHINTDMSPRAYGLTSLSEKTRSNHLQMLEQRQHLLLNYFKTLSVIPAGNRTHLHGSLVWHYARTVFSTRENSVKTINFHFISL